MEPRMVSSDSQYRLRGKCTSNSEILFIVDVYSFLVSLFFSRFQILSFLGLTRQLDAW